jgi:hypothetical protein
MAERNTHFRRHIAVTLRTEKLDISAHQHAHDND